MTYAELKNKINNAVETIKGSTNISGYKLNNILNDLLEFINNKGSEVLRYKALMTQSGTNNAVLTVLENTLGSSPISQYADPGQQTIILGQSFDINKVSIKTGNIVGIIGNTPLNTSGTFKIYTNTIGGVATNGLLANTLLEIEVYP